MYCPTYSPLSLDRQWAQMAGFDIKHVFPIFVTPSLLLTCLFHPAVALSLLQPGCGQDFQ